MLVELSTSSLVIAGVIAGIAVLALGVAVLASVARREGPEPAATEPSAAIGGESGDDHSDLDDLFAPVDDVLT